MNAVKTDVERLIHKELQSANKQFPLFNSVHEAYAVILEEAQEAKEAGDELESFMGVFWSSVKANGSNRRRCRRFVREQSVQLAVEAIQIAAMCDKFQLSFVESHFRGGA
jgi:hypothetical protein